MGTKISGTSVHSMAKFCTHPRYKRYAAAQLAAIADANARLCRLGLPVIFMVTLDNRIVTYIYRDLRTKTANRAAHKRAWTCYGGRHFSDPAIREWHND